MIDLRASIITTVVGTGTCCLSASTPAAETRLSNPSISVADTKLFISDNSQQLLSYDLTSGRVVPLGSSGPVFTAANDRLVYSCSGLFGMTLEQIDAERGTRLHIAGNGERAPLPDTGRGDGGAARNATISCLGQLVADGNNVWSMDFFGTRIRKIAVTSGIIDTVVDLAVLDQVVLGLQRIMNFVVTNDQTIFLVDEVTGGIGAAIGPTVLMRVPTSGRPERISAEPSKCADRSLRFGTPFWLKDLCPSAQARVLIDPLQAIYIAHGIGIVGSDQLLRFIPGQDVGLARYVGAPDNPVDLRGKFSIEKQLLYGSRIEAIDAGDGVGC